MIHIHSPEVHDNTVVCELDVSRPQSKFFKNDDFIVEYDESVESVPDSILAIPAVMNVAPIAWASNIELSTLVLDKEFHNALERVREGYAELYPSVFGDEDTVITCERTIANHSPDPSTPAVLFSGGVDSTAAALDVLEDSPALFTVQGNDIDLDNRTAWENVNSQVEKFASYNDLPTHSVQSNFRDILRYRFLDYSYKSKDGLKSWWGGIQYGTALPALCAPITYKKKYSPILEGSAGYESEKKPPGAHPSFVNELRWAGTQAKVADAKKSRQDKYEKISRYVESGGKLIIRSCLRSSEGKNCSECMKCRRTILGLLLEGVDPNEVGFDVDQETLSKIRTDFEAGDIQLHGIKMEFWRDIQKEVDHTNQYLYDEQGFFEWLANENLEDYGSRAKTSPIPIRVADKTIQHLPYPLDVAIYDRIRPIGSVFFGQS